MATPRQVMERMEMERVLLERARALNGTTAPPPPPTPPRPQSLPEAILAAHAASQQNATRALESGQLPRDAVSQGQTSVLSAIADWAAPEYYQKDIEAMLPDFLGPAKPFVAGALDFDPSDLANPMALGSAIIKAPIKGAKAAAEAANPLAKAAKQTPAIKLDKLGKVKEALYDDLEAVKGFNKDAYEAARVYSGSAAKAEHRVGEFVEALEPIKAKGVRENIEDALAVFSGKPTRFDRAGQYMMLDRMEEAAELLTRTDPTNPLLTGKVEEGEGLVRAIYARQEDKIPIVGGSSIEEIKSAKAMLESAIPPDEMARIKEAQAAVVAKFNQQLDSAVDAGLVSAKSAEAAKKKGLKYVPLHVLSDDAAEELGAAVGGHSANPNVDWFKNLQPMKTKVQIDNPLDAPLAAKVSATERNIEKNYVMRTITDLHYKDPDTYGSLVYPLETAPMRQSRIDLAKKINETRRKIQGISDDIGLKGKTSDVLYQKFNDTQDELAQLAGELANKNLNFEPRPEIKKVIEKVQRRQAKILATARKMKDNAAGMGDMARVLAEAEVELKAAKSEMWKMRPNNLPEGYKEIKHYRDGLQERWAIPADIADSLSRMNKHQVDIVTQIASRASRALRFGATGGNLPFVLTNAKRDFTDLPIRSQYGVNFANRYHKWVEGLFHAVKKDDVYKNFIENGGGYSTFSEVMNARPGNTAVGPGLRFAKTVTNPKELAAAIVNNPVVNAVTSVNEAVELAPRLAEFQAAIKAGADPRKAAFAGRDVTVDFMKAGTLGRVANMWSPFLNAGVQGSANIVKSLTKGGARPWIQAGAVIGVPTAVTYAYNSMNFPEIWDDISQHDKDNNTIIIYGPGVENVGAGKYYTDVIRIPKSHFTKVLANPVEQALDYARRNDPVAYDTIAMKLLNSLSPVGGISDEGEASIADFASQTAPPPLKAIGEYGFNVNTYTGRPIESESLERVKPELRFYPGDTPESMIWAGKQTGLSPVKLEQMAQTLFGGLGSQAIKATPTDPARGLREDVQRRFGKAYGGEKDRREIKALKEMEMETRSMEKMRADLLKEKYQLGTRPGKLTPEEIELLKATPPRTKDDAMRDAKSAGQGPQLNSLERFLTGPEISAENKLGWARGHLKKMSTKERDATIQRWREYKILSGEMLDQLQAELDRSPRARMQRTIEERYRP